MEKRLPLRSGIKQNAAATGEAVPPNALMPQPRDGVLLSTLRGVVRHSVAAELVVGPERAVQVGPALDATHVISG